MAVLNTQEDRLMHTTSQKVVPIRPALEQRSPGVFVLRLDPARAEVPGQRHAQSLAVSRRPRANRRVVAADVLSTGLAVTRRGCAHAAVEVRRPALLRRRIPVGTRDVRPLAVETGTASSQ